LVKVEVVWVGKTKEDWIKRGIGYYQKLLKRFADLEVIEIKAEKLTKSRAPQTVLSAEGKRILRHTRKSSSCIALDARGKSLDSKGFARWLEEEINQQHTELVFILGGPLGLSPQVVSACATRLSLSKMTFTHEMSRVILLEQIYRAFSILKGTGYHK
jgi:23S rRNA (pseudouridine1915-N3)-methyltransferase